jgi:Domain of unknown function (DUF4129)
VTPADRAREQARDILAERRFHETELPRPLQRPLDWLGDRLEPVGDLVARVADKLPGGDNVLWLVLAGLVLVGALLAASRLVARRAPRALAGRGPRTAARLPGVAELEREADAAERAGELELALRLRFRAGVLRLAELRVLDDPASATTGALVRKLRSDDFTRAARAFDEVVYGRRAATADDARLAREGWRVVLAR